MFKSSGIRGLTARLAVLFAIIAAPAMAAEFQTATPTISAPETQFTPTLVIAAPVAAPVIPISTISAPVVARLIPTLAIAAPSPSFRPAHQSPIVAIAVRIAASLGLPILRPARPADAMFKPRRPLRDLVISFVDYGTRSPQEECLAAAVFFEARGETLEGQLAVADVILNRAASGRYPPAICDVVTQRAQFSFIRRGKFPPIDRTSQNWRKALAIAEIARKDLAAQVAPNVMWFHAHYVAPAWGRTRTRVARIGSHIFYS